MKNDTEKGKILFEKGKYYVEVDGQRDEVPIGFLAKEENLKELVGQEVDVLYSEPKRFIVGLVPDKAVRKWPRIICYLPAPWERMLETRVVDSMRTTLAKQYFEEGIISEKVLDKLT